MRSLKLKYALLGEKLELSDNVQINLDSNQMIQSIEEHSDRSNLLAVPGYYDAHVHAADIGIRGRIGDDLHQVVGPGGVKQQYLSKLTKEELYNNLRQAIQEGRENGVLGFVDFREAGVKMNNFYKQFGRSYLPYIRPLPSEFDIIKQSDDPISVGIRDVVAYTPEEMIELRDIIQRTHGRIEIHASEDKILRDRWLEEYGKSDIVWSIDQINPDAIIHATLADDTDMKVLAMSNTGVIICPSSNQYFGVGRPPVQDLLDAGINLGLGSDNAMVNPISLWNDIKLLREWKISAKAIFKMATIGGARLSGLNWGIEIGNSHLLVFELPNNFSKNDIFDFVLDRSCINYLREIIVPEI